jgi:hypothetical protein
MPVERLSTETENQVRRTGFRISVAAWLLAGMAAGAQADVRTITITARGPVFNGQVFGTVGP